MSSFANLKRNKSSFDKLTKAIEATTQPAEAGSKEDTRFWQPEVDKSGNGMAVIRFLAAPAVDGDDALPWVRIFSHGFQAQGGWLIDNCLTTLDGAKCPVCDHNSTLWNSGIEANKEIVRKQKRKLNYIANVYIVSDPKHPENEGKIKLFKFGKKIFDKITEAMNPQFEDETPINPFDMWKGANFKLKIRKVEGYQNYDKSEFDSPSVLSDDDAKLEQIWKDSFSLSELTGDKEFKSYDELKKRLDKVLGLNGEAPKTTVEQVKAKTFDAPKAKAEDSPFKDDTSDDEDMAYFSKLAEED